jgi:hypothetical protein
MARNRYDVVPADKWDVTHGGAVLSSHDTKDPAVEAGRKVAQANEPSQLVVHKQDGTFEYEYTYGDDPFPPKG